MSLACAECGSTVEAGAQWPGLAGDWRCGPCACAPDAWDGPALPPIWCIRCGAPAEEAICTTLGLAPLCLAHYEARIRENMS